MLTKLGLVCAVWALAVAAFCQPNRDSAIAQQFRQRLMARFGPVGMSSEFQHESGKNIIYEDWSDPARNRIVPTKIYFPLTGTGPYPVVIFSHGLGGSREAAGYLGHYLSEHGYICVHLQHAGSDTAVVKAGLQSGTGKGLLATMQTAATWRNLELRAQDITFVLDKLTVLNRGGAALRGKIDLNKIAIAGHSFGAGSALAVSGQTFKIGRLRKNLRDERIKAAIYLSPPVNLAGRSPGDLWGAINVPGLLMTGTEDVSPIGNTAASERRLPFDGISAPHQYLVNFQGGDHMIFGGRKVGRPGDERFHTYINKICLEFLDAYLKGSSVSKSWLDGEESVAFVSPAASYERK